MADIKDIRITLVVVNPEEQFPSFGLYVNNRLTDVSQLYANDFIERVDSWLALLRTYGWAGTYTYIEYSRINVEHYFLSGLPPWADELRPAPPNRYAKSEQELGSTIRDPAWELSYNPPLPFV